MRPNLDDALLASPMLALMKGLGPYFRGPSDPYLGMVPMCLFSRAVKFGPNRPRLDDPTWVMHDGAYLKYKFLGPKIHIGPIK